MPHRAAPTTIASQLEAALDEHCVDTPESSQDLADFDGPSDPSDPQNWTRLYKWSLVIIISILSMVVNLAILMIAPAYSDILDEFNTTSRLQSTLLVSIWELGEVFGPLLIAPLTELYGRLPVYHAANFLFLLFSIVGALSTSMGMLITIRFFLGVSVASTVINPCIVGDLFKEEERGRAMGIMGMIPFIAPVLGPTIGGLIVSAKDWRWTFWLIVMLAGPLEVLFLIVYRETYKVTILRRRVAKMKSATRNYRLRSRYDLDSNASELIVTSVCRPIKMLFTLALVFGVGVCSAFGISLTYVLITSLSSIYIEIYAIDQDVVGVTYLGTGIGMVLSVIVCGTFIDWYVTQNTSTVIPTRPERRLPPLVLGAILVPLALLAFGWSVHHRLHWIIPIIFSVFIGFGFVSIAVAAWSYLVDVFGIYSASATAGNVVMRNAMAAALPLAGPPLVDRLGYGWAYTTLAAIAVTIAVPLALYLVKNGERLRGRGLKAYAVR